MNDAIKISGNIVDIVNSRIYPGTLIISKGRIVDITQEKDAHDAFIIPGFIDSHVHIESSMLTPAEFARAAVIHGTVATVSDPHEIANVLGIDGVRYMIENAKTVPVKFYFGAPSCVPATGFETNGAVIGPEQTEELLKMEEIKYLAEVMNFPGVIHGDPEVDKKINIAKKYSKTIDGHAPGLRGEGLIKYVNAGITTDHECLDKEEALEKIGLGMKILIREGSAARNFDELVPLLENHSGSCMFCSDDKHPDDLVKGHINDMVKKAASYGIDIMKILSVACVNPVSHYGLDVGLLQKGDAADFLIIDNLKEFNVLKTYIHGEAVAAEGKSLLTGIPSKLINNFHAGKKRVKDFRLPYRKGNINVIEAADGQVIADKLVMSPHVVGENVVSDIKRDILKTAVINRYRESKPAIGFIKNFGLKHGAIASSIAHDSHNIITIGVSDQDICRAANLIIEHKGGIGAVSRDKEMILPLPVAGLISNDDYYRVAAKYSEINVMAKALGSTLSAPFMTLSFMALLVIPKLKLGDRGLFDGERFEFVDIFV